MVQNVGDKDSEIWWIKGRCLDHEWLTEKSEMAIAVRCMWKKNWVSQHKESVEATLNNTPFADYINSSAADCKTSVVQLIIPRQHHEIGKEKQIFAVRPVVAEVIR